MPTEVYMPRFVYWYLVGRRIIIAVAITSLYTLASIASTLTVNAPSKMGIGIDDSCD